jgi:hypothetical protein
VNVTPWLWVTALLLVLLDLMLMFVWIVDRAAGG